MNRNSSPKDQLIPLLNDLYQRIHDAEAEIGLWAGANDHRPRIERFHDAIRAYTNGVSPYEAGSRLSIEQLSWDISMLRAIQSKPLTPMPNSQKQSPHTGLTLRKPNAVGDPGNPQASARAFKAQLASDYKNYAVMFTAILAETADMNHNSRMEDKDQLVEQLASMRNQLSGKTVNLQKMAGSMVYDPQTLSDLMGMLPRETMGKAEAEQVLKNAMSQVDLQQKKLDNAHLTWLSGQLAMYEQGKEVVQQLMREGLNLAGRFLEESMARGQGGPAHGQGRGY